MPQTDSQDGITVDPLGVYVHEFGHWLGLPDLYPTGLFPFDGVGTWGLMGGGIYNKGTDGISGSAPAQRARSRDGGEAAKKDAAPRWH